MNPRTVDAGATARRHARRDAGAMLVGSASRDLTYRIAQVALPLVVLSGTHDVAAVGIVGGAAGLPVLLSPWWAGKARQWVDRGLRLAMVSTAEAAAFALIPAVAALGAMNVWSLVAIDLAIGACEALSIPGSAALTADVGDRLGPDRAVHLLTWQDALRRVTMLVGPALGAVCVGLGWTVGLLFGCAAALLVTGWVAAGVPASPVLSDDRDSALRIRRAVRGHGDVIRGWVMRGSLCLVWFAFTLGLAVRGVEVGRPGVYYAVGITAYGVGSLCGTALVPLVIRRWPLLRVATVAWVFGGLAWAGMGLWTSMLGLALTAGVGGAFVVCGIAAVNAVITRETAGATRRTLLSAQSVVVNATSSLGTLVGGVVLACCGVAPTLLVSGCLLVLVAVVAGLPGWRGRQGPVTAAADRMTPSEDDGSHGDGRRIEHAQAIGVQ